MWGREVKDELKGAKADREGVDSSMERIVVLLEQVLEAYAKVIKELKRIQAIAGKGHE
jgi:hypothetical protein